MDLLKMRMLHCHAEEECEDDYVSTDACAEDKINCEETLNLPIFNYRYRKPQDSDLQGIKSLLKEIFPDAHLDLDSLTRLIISQYIGFVLKQTSSEEEGAIDINDPMNVHIVSTVIPVKQNVNCILQLRDHLMILANEYAPDSTKDEIMHILQDDAVKLILLINERNTGIPVELSIGPLESLFVNLQQKRCERCELNSTYCIYISKVFKTTKKYKKELNKNNILQKEKNLWINLEEKIIAKQATYSFEFSIDSELVNGLPNKLSWLDGPDYWNPDDYDTAVPYRRVLIFELSKWQTIIDKMRSKFNYYESFHTSENVQL